MFHSVSFKRFSIHTYNSKQKIRFVRYTREIRDKSVQPELTPSAYTWSTSCLSLVLFAGAKKKTQTKSPWSQTCQSLNSLWIHQWFIGRIFEHTTKGIRGMRGIIFQLGFYVQYYEDNYDKVIAIITIKILEFKHNPTAEKANYFLSGLYFFHFESVLFKLCRIKRRWINLCAHRSSAF